jgi:hypothetical protein
LLVTLKILAPATAAVCFVLVIVLITNVQRTGYRANCLHTNQGIHLLLDGPITAGIENNQATLKDPTVNDLDRAKATSSLTAQLEFQRLVNYVYSDASCRWPPVSLVPPAVTNPTTTTTEAR